MGQLVPISEVRLPVRSERRDPTAATDPTGYQSPGQPMVPAWDAWQAFQYGYLANTFVYACVKAIAEDISRLPIRVGDPTTGSYDVNHPLAVHLGPPPGGPNPATAARKLIAWSVVQWLVTGRISWEIEAGSSGRPVAYWPLPGVYLKPIPSQGGTSYFTGYEYGPGNNPKRLPAESVFYSWDPSPNDWRQAESRLQAMRLDISVAVMQDRYDYAFLKNDSRPAAIVVHEAFAARDEREAFRRQFRSHHEGPDNAGRVAFAEAEGGEGGIASALDVKVLGFSQKDSQAIQRYDAKLRAITVGLGVPLSRLGDASGRTFSNADAEGTFYWRNTILPKVLDLGDAFTMQLLDRYGAGGGTVYFDTSGVDALQEGGNVAPIPAADLVSAGAVTRNELRQLAGLAPSDDPAFDEYETPPAPPPPPQIHLLPTGNPDQASGLPPARGRDPFGVRAPIEGPGADEVRATNLWRSATAQIDTLESVWTRELRRLFAQQERATIARLNGKRGRQLLRKVERPPTETGVLEPLVESSGPELRQFRAPGGELVPSGTFSGFGRELFDPGFWAATTEEIFAGLYSQVFGVAGARVSDEFGISFNLLQQGVDDQIQARANQLAGQVTDTTFRQLQDQLTDGVIAGDSIPVLADRIRLVFDAASERRATTIARTEVISSFNGAQVAAARALPPDVVGGMEWISTRDARTRSAHRGRYPAGPDGQVVPITEAFLVGGEHLHYPGDPSGSAGNVINCRCAVAFLDPEEFRQRYAAQQDSGEVAPTAEGPPPAEPTPLAPDQSGYTKKPTDFVTEPIVQKSQHGLGTSAEIKPATGPKAKAISHAQGVLDSLLRLPDHVADGLPEPTGSWERYGGKLPTRIGGQSRGSNGTFWRGRTVALSTSVARTASDPGFTFAHEFGHFLDFVDVRLKSRLEDTTAERVLGSFSSEIKSLPAWSEFHGAVRASDAWATFQGMKGNRQYTAPNGKVYGVSKVDSYWTSETETFARAFAQWVAVRSGDPALLKSLRDHQGTGWPSQWSDDDFVPIGKALDELFTAVGILA